jgi:hypothetical protein
MLLKIAATMPKAPKKPDFNIAIKQRYFSLLLRNILNCSFSEFMKYFNKYYETFKKKYSELSIEERDKMFLRRKV